MKGVIVKSFFRFIRNIFRKKPDSVKIEVPEIRIDIDDIDIELIHHNEDGYNFTEVLLFYNITNSLYNFMILDVYGNIKTTHDEEFYKLVGEK